MSDLTDAERRMRWLTTKNENCRFELRRKELCSKVGSMSADDLSYTLDYLMRQQAKSELWITEIHLGANGWCRTNWIRWEGGPGKKCPVPADTQIEARIVHPRRANGAFNGDWTTNVGEAHIIADSYWEAGIAEYRIWFPLKGQ